MNGRIDYEHAIVRVIVRDEDKVFWLGGLWKLDINPDNATRNKLLLRKMRDAFPPGNRLPARPSVCAEISDQGAGVRQGLRDRHERYRLILVRAFPRVVMRNISQLPKGLSTVFLYRMLKTFDLGL